MKRGMIIMILSCMAQCVAAQTTAEWLQQKKTQIKYYLEQIAQLQIYIGHAKKGYELMSQGWNVIQQVKNGEFRLHQAFITSLSKVNPAIAQFADATAVILQQIDLYKRYKGLLTDAISKGTFTAEEIGLFHDSFSALLDQMALTVDELVRVVSSGKLQMADDERLRRIMLLRQESAGQYHDFTRMEHAILQMAEGRRQEQADIKVLESWHGTNK